MNLTDFDITRANLKIRLAVTYEPAILNNCILERRYNGFLYVLNGAYNYKFEDAEKETAITVSKDNLIYLPAGSVPYSYTVVGSDGCPAESMQLEFEICNSKNGMPISFSRTPTPISSHLSAIKESMLTIVDLYASSYRSEQLKAYSELVQILSLICTERSEKKSSAYKSVLPAIKHIEKNYATKISSAELAEICSMSESQLRRCFKSALEISPKAYQNSLLMKSAKSLLSLGEFSIGEIAERLGFYDIYAFSHFFSKKAGCSPSDFVKK